MDFYELLNREESQRYKMLIWVSTSLIAFIGCLIIFTYLAATVSIYFVIVDVIAFISMLVMNCVAMSSNNKLIENNEVI